MSNLKYEFRLSKKVRKLNMLYICKRFI